MLIRQSSLDRLHELSRARCRTLVTGGALVPLHHLKISAISLLQFQRIWFATKSSQTAATVSFAMRRMTQWRCCANSSLASRLSGTTNLSLAGTMLQPGAARPSPQVVQQCGAQAVCFEATADVTHRQER